ncbi:hypothetical protein Hanom_Chr15g01337561 [Helianthus anomalus]
MKLLSFLAVIWFWGILWAALAAQIGFYERESLFGVETGYTHIVKSFLSDTLTVKKYLMSFVKGGIGLGWVYLQVDGAAGWALGWVGTVDLSCSFWAGHFMGWDGDIRGRWVVNPFSSSGRHMVAFFSPLAWSLGSCPVYVPFLNRRVLVVDIIWWLVPCGVLGPILNPGGIRQAWLGGISFLCNPPWSSPPMPESLLGCRNHVFVSDLVFRWDWAWGWAICRNSACHNGCGLGLLWSNFSMMYWAFGRWLLSKIWRGSCRLTRYNSSWLQFERPEVRGKMVKCPAVTIRGLRRHMGTNVLMYLKIQARWVLNCCCNSCWKVLVQAKCGNNLVHLTRLYVIWVKTKNCIKWLVTCINYVWRFMVRVRAATLTKDQLQSATRVCCLCSKAIQLLKACGQFLLGIKHRSTVKYMGQGAMSMLQAPGWIIKEYTKVAEKGYGLVNGNHSGHNSWGWGYWAVIKCGQDLYTCCWWKKYYGLTPMRHMLFTRSWVHGTNPNFWGPQVWIDMRWADRTSVCTRCKFGLVVQHLHRVNHKGPGLVGIYSMGFGPRYNTATLELTAQVVVYWALLRLIYGYGIIITKQNFGMLGENVGQHHFIGWRRIQVTTKVNLRDTDFCGPPSGYGPPCIYSRDSIRFVSHCKARALCIPRVGLMVSYFWSPKHVSGDGKGGMPPLKV